MKSFILALVLYTVVLGLGIGGLAYLRFNQPKFWNLCLTALMAPQDAGVKTSDSTPTQAPSVTPPPAERPLESEVISPDSTFANSDHVRQVSQPSQQPSGMPTGTTTDAAAVTAPNVFVPPNPLPAQVNWNWNVQGKVYNSVVVTQVEADRVHITYDGGVGSVNMADLSPDLQKVFNYDPQLAALAAKARKDEQAKFDAEQAPIIAAHAAANAQLAAAGQAQQTQASQAEAAQERVAVAQDQKSQIQADMRQMEGAHEIIIVTDRLGGVRYLGSPYWLDKYNADQRATAQCDQIINSGGK